VRNLQLVDAAASFAGVGFIGWKRPRLQRGPRMLPPVTTAMPSTLHS